MCRMEEKIKNKWVFALKKDRAGKVIRYKARIVTKGFSQIPRIDFTVVFSPVTKYCTARLLIVVSVQFGCQRSLLDIKSAFVNAALKEELHMAQPESFEVKGFENYGYCLNNVLYGLRQASREWNDHLNNF